MPVLQRREIEVSMQFECEGCGLCAPVVVRGRGVATGAFATEGLSERARRDAMANAQLRCDLVPCPHCGRRNFARFKRALVKTCVWSAGFVVFLVAFEYVYDSSLFTGNYAWVGWVIYATVAVLLFGWIALGSWLEVRNAPRKVRFVTAP